MQLVDEEDDAPLALFDLVEDGFQPLLELAAELRARDERAHIQGEDGLVLKPFWDIAAHDTLRQPLHDGGLAHAGLADEDGIVLGLARKDADDVPDLVVPPYDGVEFLLFCAFYEVETVFSERVVGVLRLVGRHPVGLHLFELRLKRPLGHAEGAEDVLYLLRGMVEEGEHDVLHGDVFVPLCAREPLRACQDLVRDGRDVDLVGLSAAAAHRGHLAYGGVQHGKELVRVRARPAEQVGDEPAVLIHKGIEEMLRHHLHVLVFNGYILRRAEGFQRLLGKFLCVHSVHLLKSISRRC